MKLRYSIIAVVFFIIGWSSGYFLQMHHHSLELQVAVERGRLSTPSGVYYLLPVPSLPEVEQMRKDVEWLNKSLNKAKRR